jgi:hypothetical protein
MSAFLLSTSAFLYCNCNVTQIQYVSVQQRAQFHHMETKTAYVNMILFDHNGTYVCLSVPSNSTIHLTFSMLDKLPLRKCVFTAPESEILQRTDYA